MWGFGRKFLEKAKDPTGNVRTKRKKTNIQEKVSKKLEGKNVG